MEAGGEGTRGAVAVQRVEEEAGEGEAALGAGGLAVGAAVGGLGAAEAGGGTDAVPLPCHIRVALAWHAPCTLA